MANILIVPERRSVDRERHPLFALLNRCIHSSLTAYVIIAFAISLGFHELGVRADTKLRNAIALNCRSLNELRIEHNTQLEILVAEFNRQLPTRRVITVPHLPFTNCAHIPDP